VEVKLYDGSQVWY